MEPEERRRIQNRLAQRKFRKSPCPLISGGVNTQRASIDSVQPGEKAKDHKEKSERDARNQEFAGSTYSIPAANELLDDNGECSGLPWGSISMQHVARYHESQGSRNSGGSGHGDYVRSSNAYGQYLGYDTEQRTSPSYQSYGSHDNSSGGDFFDDTTYYYNADYDTTQ